MEAKNTKVKRRLRRRKHIRKSIFGTAERPRLSVYRSNSNIYAQIIDDEQGKTLCSASTTSKEVADAINYGGNCGAAEQVGTLLAQRAVMHGIKQIAFDRGGYRYHGRVKALAEAARKAGLEF